jgi:hypothetical protein
MDFPSESTQKTMTKKANTPDNNPALKIPFLSWARAMVAEAMQETANEAKAKESESPSNIPAMAANETAKKRAVSSLSTNRTKAAPVAKGNKACKTCKGNCGWRS